MVTLVESGYADQKEVAQAFGHFSRSLRRHQERLTAGGVRALGRPRGRPSVAGVRTLGVAASGCAAIT